MTLSECRKLLFVLVVILVVYWRFHRPTNYSYVHDSGGGAYIDGGGGSSGSANSDDENESDAGESDGGESDGGDCGGGGGDD